MTRLVNFGNAKKQRQTLEMRKCKNTSDKESY